jgi:hypothetical protein
MQRAGAVDCTVAFCVFEVRLSCNDSRSCDELDATCLLLSVFLVD